MKIPQDCLSIMMTDFSLISSGLITNQGKRVGNDKTLTLLKLRGCLRRCLKMISGHPVSLLLLHHDEPALVQLSSLSLSLSPLLSCKVKSTPHGHNMETPSIMHPSPSGAFLISLSGNTEFRRPEFGIGMTWKNAPFSQMSPCRHTVWPCESRRRRRLR